MLNDVDLLEKIVQKDKDAFESIYKAYFRKLYTLSFRYVRDEAIAEELTNDVFMMLWENAGKLAINKSLGAYLSRSVINLSLTRLKKNQRLLDRNNDYIKDLDLTDDKDQADLATLYESKLLMIESILESLPPQCRKIVLMSKYDKMKQQEIADQLGISIKTVKNHLTIAYDKIRVELAKQRTYLLLLIGFLFFSLGLFVQFIIL